MKIWRKYKILSLLIVYVISYLLNSFFFVGEVLAEDPIHNTNMVAVFVESEIYDDIKSDVERYATNYIQDKITNSKALVFPINTEEFKAKDIVKILENLYFDGLEEDTSTLVGTILIGDLPLPVLNNQGFIYPSIFPYVDFEEQQFILNGSSQYFEYNDNPNGQAEIWHGIINFKDDKNQYNSFFDKLRDYNNNPGSFIGTDLWYDDFVATKKYFSEEKLQGYINHLMFVEDISYHRYTNLLLNIMQGSHNDDSQAVFTEFVDKMSDLEFSDEGFENRGDTLGDYQDSLGDYASQIEELMEDENSSMPSSSSTQTPTLILQKSISEFLKPYYDLMGTKNLANIRDNVKSAGRWSSTGMDSHYTKITQRDNRILGNNSMQPLITQFNNKLEEKLNEQIESQNYYMTVPIFFDYEDWDYEYKCWLKLFKKCVFWSKKTKTKLDGKFQNTYFGYNAVGLNNAQDASIYRGTFQNFNTNDEIENREYLRSDLDSIGVDIRNKSVGATYAINDRQIEAHRGFSFNLANTDLELYNKYKCSNSETITGFVAKYRGGFSPLNIVTDDNGNLDLGDHNFDLARDPYIWTGMGTKIETRDTQEWVDFTNNGGTTTSYWTNEGPDATNYDYDDGQNKWKLHEYNQETTMNGEWIGGWIKEEGEWLIKMEDGEPVIVDDEVVWEHVSYESGDYKRAPGYWDRQFDVEVEVPDPDTYGWASAGVGGPIFDIAGAKITNDEKTTAYDYKMLDQYYSIQKTASKGWDQGEDLDAATEMPNFCDGERETMDYNKLQLSYVYKNKYKSPGDDNCVSIKLYKEVTDTPTAKESGKCSGFKKKHYYDIRNYKYKMVDTRVVNTAPTLEQINGMDITTLDRPIDSIRNITFKGIGGDVVKFIYPNLYEVEVFEKSDGILTLKEPKQIEFAIKDYLKKKVQQYNDDLQTQLSKKTSYYNSDKEVFDFINSTDSLANPNRSYSLMSENFLIDLLGESSIETVAELLYYQNIPWKERKLESKVVNDIDMTKTSFNINHKILDILNGYLAEGNEDQGPIILPTYKPDGYEVAYINSDGFDYIQPEIIPGFISDLQKAKNKYTEENSVVETYDKSSFEQEIEKECGYDPTGAVMLPDWPDAFMCWLEKTLEKPFTLTFDWSHAQGPVLFSKDELPGEDFVEEVEDSFDNSGDQWEEFKSNRAEDPTEENNNTINNANPEQAKKLQDILQYTVTKVDNNSLFIDNDEITSEIELLSTRDLGEIDIIISAEGDNCLQINNLSNDLCEDPAELSTNFFDNKQKLNLELKDNTAGTTVINFDLCVEGTDYCVTKNQTINIIPGQLADLQVETSANKVIAGAELAILVEGYDQHGNQLGQQIDDFKIATNIGELSDNRSRSDEVIFSNFGKSKFRYFAPKNVDHGTVSTIWVGPSSPNSDLPSKEITVTIIKGKLTVKYEGDIVDENNEIEFQLDEDLEEEPPLIELELKDQNGNYIDGRVSVISKKGLVIPGDFDDDSFIGNTHYSIKGGKTELYIKPLFNAGEDVLQVIVPGLDPINIPINILGGEAKIVNLKLDKEVSQINEEIKAKVSLTDRWNNVVSKDTDIEVGAIGPLNIDGDKTTTINIKDGQGEFEVTTAEPGGKGYVFATIEDLDLEEQNPGFQGVIAQKSLIPTEKLNVLYLNIFGTDRGNQWGYFSENKKFVEEVMDDSNKLLAVTTQLMDHTKLRKFDFVVSDKGQVQNIGELDNYLTIKNDKISVEIDDIGYVNILDSSDFTLQARNSLEGVEIELKQKPNKNYIYYIPEEIDSVITDNQVDDNKLLINDKTVLNLSQANIDPDLVIIPSENKLLNKYNVWEVIYNDTLVGSLILYTKENVINKSGNEIKIYNTLYDSIVTFAEGSTNGDLGIGLYQIDSGFPTETKLYKSIEDSVDPTLKVGFRGDFKNITLFAAGETVGDATIPFGSHLLINIGDPLIERIEENPQITHTEFDGSLGEAVYSDPGKSIFKTIPIDFNNDDLYDLLVAHTDGSVKIMKNYGGTQPFKEDQGLMLLSDGLKDIYVGDVDGNNYDDIIIRTTSNQLRIYTNFDGIFDVNGYMACLDVAGGPDNLELVEQLFIQDMDQDDKMDIITNDSDGDIKIFYGGNSSYKDDNNNTQKRGNYISTLKYTCDKNWEDRQEDNVKLVKSFGIQLQESLKITDNSLTHWKGLFAPDPSEGDRSDVIEMVGGDISDETLDGLLNSDTPDIDEISENMTDYMTTDGPLGAMGDFDPSALLSSETYNLLRYKIDPLGIMPAYEDKNDFEDQELVYVPIQYINDEDPITIYKTYDDRNGDILRIGDTVKVKVILKAKDNGKFTFVDHIRGPWIMDVDETNRIKTFEIKSNDININNLEIKRDINQEYGYMVDNIDLDQGDRLEISYELIYDGKSPITIDVKDIENIEESIEKDDYPDIVVGPMDSCSKASWIFANTKKSSKDYKDYEELFVDIQAKLDEYNSQAQETLDNYMSDMGNTISDVVSNQDMSALNESLNVFESRSSDISFDDLVTTDGLNVDLGTIDLGFIDDLTADVQAEMDKALAGLCGGFKVGGGGCQGPPVPFNMDFLSPGNFNIFGCSIKPSFSGLPIFHFPGTMYIMGAPVPFPWGMKGPGDSFYWIPGGSYPSQIRIYLTPTLTMGLGLTICLGPMSLASAIPSPFRDIGGNCIVIGITRSCDDDDNDPNGSDQVLEDWMLDLGANGSCSQPPIAYDGTYASSPFQLVSSSEDSSNYSNAFQGDNFDGGLVNYDQRPSPINISNDLFQFDQVPLKAGSEIDLKIKGGNLKGLAKCIIQDWLDRQIKYVMNNMTKMSIGIYFPDLSQLAEGFDSLSVSKLKKIIKAENNVDVVEVTKKASDSKIANWIKNKSIQKGQLNNLSAKVSNPFDAVSMMFEEVPLVNMNTKDINVKVPMLYSEDVEKYESYLKNWLKVNQKILKQWEELIKSIMGDCRGKSPSEIKEDLVGELQEMREYLKARKEEIEEDMSTLVTPGDGTEDNGNSDDTLLTNEEKHNYDALVAKLRNLYGELDKLQEEHDLSSWLDNDVNRLEFQYIYDQINAVYEQLSKMGYNPKNLEKIDQCLNLFGGEFDITLNIFVSIKENIALLIKSIRENIKVLEMYKKFPLELYEWVHVGDRYLSELSSIISAFVGTLTNWMNTNANRYSQYIDAIILIVGAIKTWQAIIDFSANWNESCSSCSNDNYGYYGCSLAFLCPEIPILPIPPFKLPNIWIDLSNIDVGIDILLPNFNFTPMNIPLPKLPNIPEPPQIDVELNLAGLLFDKIGLAFGSLGDLNVPELPILPKPPTLPEIPSFLPSIDMELPILPPAPKIPSLMPEIEAALEIAEFIGKIYCITKGGIGLVGEKGVKSKVEQVTQRDWDVPFFDEFDLTLNMQDPPLQGLDYKIDAFVEMKFNFEHIYQYINSVASVANNTTTELESTLDQKASNLTEELQGGMDFLGEKLEEGSDFLQEQADKATDEIEDAINKQTDKVNNAIDSATEGIQNDVNDFFDNLDPFGYIPGNSKEKVEYVSTYKAKEELTQGLELFRSKTDDKQILLTVNEINSMINHDTTVKPMTKEVEKIGEEVHKIIESKQQEIRDLSKQIKYDYPGFLKDISTNNVQLVSDNSVNTTFKTRLFEMNENTKKFFETQKSPTQQYLDLNHNVIKGYKNALDNNSPINLNMNNDVYGKTKNYVNELDNGLTKIAGIFDSDNTPKAQAPEVQLAQGCTTCDDSGGEAGYSTDISQYIKGVFIETINDEDEKVVVNVVRSEENINKIKKNYFEFDINNDNEDDIIMRDKNNIYVKYYEQNDEHEEDAVIKNRDSKYYLYELDSPEKLWDDSYEGVVSIRGLDIKLRDQMAEVKNFRLAGQSFESISFSWLNSNFGGDQPEGYILKLNHRVDTFMDKDQIIDRNSRDLINKRYVLMLPDDTDYAGGLISLEDGYPDKKPIESLMTGDIFEVKFYDPEEENIKVTIAQMPRNWQYTQIATLKTAQDKLSKRQQDSLTLYELGSSWSNQVIAGTQLIGDSMGPVPEITLYRPQTQETVSTGTTHKGYINTNYDFHVVWDDNVAVSKMRIEYNDEIVDIKENDKKTGFIDLNGLFFTGTNVENYVFGATDFNENTTRTKVNLKVEIPTIKIVDVIKLSEDAEGYATPGQIIAEISNDMDEGAVSFQKERGSKREGLTGTINGDLIDKYLLEPKQTVVTGGIYDMSNVIGLYLPDEKQIGEVYPDNGKIEIFPDYQDTIEVKVTFISGTPTVGVSDKENDQDLFWIALKGAEIDLDQPIKIHNGNYKIIELEDKIDGEFENGYCIQNNTTKDCIMYVSPNAKLYVPSEYTTDIVGEYEFDDNEEIVSYILNDIFDNKIATVKFKTITSDQY